MTEGRVRTSRWSGGSLNELEIGREITTQHELNQNSELLNGVVIVFILKV